jgi:hypothetical protein
MISVVIFLTGSDNYEQLVLDKLNFCMEINYAIYVLFTDGTAFL